MSEKEKFIEGLKTESILCGMMMRIAQGVGETKAASIYRETGKTLVLAGIVLTTDPNAPQETFDTVKAKVAAVGKALRNCGSALPEGSGARGAANCLADDIDALCAA